LALGAAGILVLVWRSTGDLHQNPIGPVILIASSIGWATVAIFHRRYHWTIGKHANAAWQLVIGVLPMVPLALMIEGITLPTPSLISVLGALYAGFVSFLVMFVVWITLINLYPAYIAGTGTLLVPVVGLTTAALVFGEPLGWPEFSAMALIAAAIFLILVLPAWRDAHAK